MVKREIEKIYSLSPMQQGMLFHWLMQKETAGEDAYYRQSVFAVTGDINGPVFEESVNSLIERYEALRTIFVYDKIQKPKQVVLKKIETVVKYEDISHLDREEVQPYLETFQEEDRKEGFDLTKGPLMRVALFKTADNAYTLVWSYHHIIMDGWCLGIIFGDLVRIYQGLRKGEPLNLAPVVPYRDYIKWLESRDMEEGLRYWQNYLDGYESRASLPRLKPMPEGNGYRLEEYDFTIDGELFGQLLKIATENQVTVNTLCQTIWAILLQRYNNTHDVVFGATVSGRPFEIPGIERMVGLFINTVPVRIRAGRGQHFSQLLKTVQRDAMLSQSHEYLPLADIQTLTPLKGDLVHHLMVFENYPMENNLKETGNEQGPGFSVQTFETRTRTNYDLNILVTHTNTLGVTFNFNGSIYEMDFMKKVASQFQELVKQVSGNPFISIEDIRLISEEEKQQLLYEFNDIRASYPENKTIHALFEEQAQRTPDAVAVLENNRTYRTYKELNEKSNQLAHRLRERGVVPDTIVAMKMEPSIHMITGILGILKSGGAYLPIDPKLPEQRIRYMLEDSSAGLLLSEDNEVVHLVKNIGPIGPIGPIKSSFSTQLAYVIYTSGTTGKPKGVLVQHYNVVRLLFNDKSDRLFDFNDSDVWTMFHSYNFDFSVWEMYGALLYGGKLVIIPPMLARDPGRFLEVLQEERVTVLNQTPSAFYSLADAALNRPYRNLYLRYIVFGGEALNPIQLKEWKERYPETKLINMFGITETTVHVTYKELTDHDINNNISNIGKPIPTLTTYVLDGKGRLMPIGAAGELYVGGEGLARGYLNRPELTAEKFVIHHSSFITHHLYRSGDLARLSPNGDLEYLGRIDHQVQIRGYRVELGEIEGWLMKHEAVKEAVVLAREDGSTEKTLCAYIVVHPSHSPGSPDSNDFPVSRLREYLAGFLPAYMVPAHFVKMEKIPLTSNGKVDRKSLPAPQIGVGENYTAPTGEIEEKLVAIWSEVLMARDVPVGIDDNFFHLGGHSLKITLLVSRIHKELNVRVPVTEVFIRPTIRELAAYIEGTEKGEFTFIQPAEPKEYYPLSSAQERLFILNEIRGINTDYNMPLVINIEGKPDRGQFESTFRALIRRHESLRTSFHLVDDQPMQKVHQEVEFNVEYQDNTRDFIRPFDLSRAPLLRAALVRLDEEKYKLLLDMHHIISDGVSMGILVRDFVAIYKGEQPPPLRIQYKDFSQWQNRLFASDDFKKQEKYWLEEQFGKGIPVLNMPMDFERPQILTFEGSSVSTVIPAEKMEKIYDAAARQDVTLNILFFAVYALLLSKYSKQEEMIIGSLVAGRNHADLERLMGMFGNFLPIKVKIQPHRPFREILQAVKTTVLRAYDNQDYPFERIVQHLDVSADASRNPLFDTMLIFHNEMDIAVEGEIQGLRFTIDDVERDTSHLDFKLDVYPSKAAGGGDTAELHLYLQYNTNLFKEETMKKLMDDLNRVLDEVVDNPEQTPEQVQLLSVNEKSQLLQLAVCATFTEEPIQEYVKWWCKKFDLEVELQFASYNQVFQELIDENSLISSNRGVNLMLVRFEDWLRDAHVSDSDEQIIAALEKHFEQMIRVIKEKNKTIPYFFGIFPVSNHLSFGPAVVSHLEAMSRQWKTVLEEMENVYTIDFIEAVELYGIDEVFDAMKDREGHMPFTDEFYAAMGTLVARKLVALKTPPHKVIVLDCDNTLWKGICGEDGTMGVRIEGPYKELQQFMLKKLDEGMLLALCSKNNEADVWEVFEQNPGMLLKRDHLVGWKINWNPKPGNLQELATELNLGIDSFIFVDDNPMECSQMMEHCPGVLTLQLPEDPGEIPMFLKHIWAFDRLKVTAEDKKRTQMYITERKRREVKSSISSLEDFIKNLQLKVVMGRIEPSQVPRAAQLTQRTNQFNLSTIRRTESELGELLKSPGIDTRVVHVSDRFGDYGLVGVVITKEQDDHLFIDTFLLSCRVLGRTVENAIMAGLKDDCKEKNINTLHAKFVPTKKNKPFLEFLEKTNWETIEETDAYTLYKLSPDQIPEKPGYVDLTFTGGMDEKRDHEAAVEERETLLEKLHQVNELYVLPHRSHLETYKDYSAFIDELLGALLRYSRTHNDSVDYIVEAYNEYYLGFSKLQEEFQKSGCYRFASYSELESALNPTFYKDYIYILLLSYITTYYRFEMKRFIDEAFEKYLSNGTETGLEVGFGTGIDLVERLKYFRAYDVFDTNRFSKSIFDVLFSTNGKLRFHHSFFNFDKEEKYSCVQLIELLEHLENPGAYIEGAYKVLKPGGVLIFTAAVNMANIDHIHLFSSFKDVEALIDPARWELLDKKHCINSLFKYSEEESKEIIEEKSSPYISVYVARKR